MEQFVSRLAEPKHVSAVPTLDLATAEPGAIAEALIASSCAFVTGHGVDPSVRIDLVEKSKAFFDLPSAEKAAVRWPGDGLWRGWQPLVDGAVNTSGAEPDVLERFEVQLDVQPGDSDEELARRAGATFGLWPEHPGGFALAWARYYAALRGVTNTIVTSIAEALDLPLDQLETWRGEHHANLVVNNYVSTGSDVAADKLRQRPHTDIGGLTVLWADDAPGGLEVRLPGVPGWTAVSFPPDAFLIQAGDLLARWTNQIIRANIHQVVRPPAEHRGPSRRISVVYFHYPRLDTVVTPAPSCVSGERPAARSIDAEAHLLDAVARPTERYRELEATLSAAP